MCANDFPCANRLGRNGGWETEKKNQFHCLCRVFCACSCAQFHHWRSKSTSSTSLVHIVCYCSICSLWVQQQNLHRITCILFFFFYLYWAVYHHYHQIKHEISVCECARAIWCSQHIQWFISHRNWRKRARTHTQSASNANRFSSCSSSSSHLVLIIPNERQQYSIKSSWKNFIANFMAAITDPLDGNRNRHWYCIFIEIGWRLGFSFECSQDDNNGDMKAWPTACNNNT